MTETEEVWIRLESVAKVTLAVGGLFSLAVLSYFLYYYGWTGERQFTGPMGVVLYYVVPAGAAGLLFAALGLKQTHKINLAIFCFSLIVSACGSELFLRLTNSLPLDPKKPIMIYVRDSQDRPREVMK